jgi:hypothetical protein
LADVKICASCGRSFKPRAHYYRVCLDCWKRAHDADVYAQGWQDGAAAGGGMRPGLLRGLLVLVHPDHQPEERRRLANEVTAALLEIRDSRRRRRAA